MSSIVMRGARWYANYKDGVGRTRQKALPSAITKTEARRLAEEIEQKGWRQRVGLDAMPFTSDKTLGDTCEWWLRDRCPAGSLYNETARLRHHIVDAPVGKIALPYVTTAVLQDVLSKMERDGLGPDSCNRLRGTLVTIFNKARKAGLWQGQNPAIDTERRKKGRRVYSTLEADEVHLVLAQVDDDWRNLFATAVYTGMRKGELFALQKIDVNVDAGTIIVRRSHDRDSTKSGHEAVVPMATALIPYLKDALEKSPNHLVFPAADGSQRSREADPQKVLRTALKHAGLVLGYDHTCRRCKAAGTPYVERHPDDALRVCPACGMKLWPKALPRPMRFHDLRHTTATLLLRAGVDVHRVQRVLRHSDPRLTTGTYGHLVVEDLRESINLLPGRATRDGDSNGTPAPW